MTGPVRSDYDDPDHARGFWSPHTATMDWCERNYAVSQYFAEFWNSWSNILMIVLPLYGLYLCRHYRLRRSFYAAQVLFFLVGIGSFGFHATLRYDMQLLDELPMIYVNCAYCYILFSPMVQRRNVLLYGNIAYGVIITLVYIEWKNPIFHEVAYAAVIFAMIARSVAVLRQNPPRRAKILLATALSLYGFGFVLWNIDNHFCRSVEHFKLHAWWHIFAGYGTYLFSVFLELVVGRETHKTEMRRGLLHVPYVHFDVEKGE